jgi:hypothetical protein
MSRIVIVILYISVAISFYGYADWYTMQGTSVKSVRGAICERTSVQCGQDNRKDIGSW